MELSQFDLKYKPRSTIKRQVVADFISEFSYLPSEQQSSEVGQETIRNLSTWNLYVDGSSNRKRAGAGLLLVSPEGIRIHGILRFGFKATNNESEYEALLVGL